MPASDTEQQSRLQRTINNLLEKRIKLVEREIELQQQQGRAIGGLSRDAKRLTDAQRKVNEAFEWGEQTVKRYATAVGAVALAHKAYSIATSSSQKSTAQWLHTAQGLGGIATSYDEIGRRAREYQEIVKNDVMLSAQFGTQLEEVRRVSERWVRVLRFVNGYSAENVRHVRDLTEVTIAYSKVLGEDQVAVVEKAENRMWRYGESAEEALRNLIQIRSATVAVNNALSDLKGNKEAYLWPDDFSKLVEQAQQNTRGWVQDISTLTSAMAASAQQAQETGLSYDESMKAAEAMGKFVTGGGAEGGFTMILGLRFIERIKAARDEVGELREAFLSQYSETERAELKRLNRLEQMGTNYKDLSLLAHDTFATSEIGIRELIRLTREMGGGRVDMMPILERERNLTREEASLIQSMLFDMKSEDEVLNRILQNREAANKETKSAESNMEGLVQQSRALEGKVFGVKALDDAIMGWDKLVGKVRAHFEDTGTVLKYAIAAAVISGFQLVRAFNSVKLSAAQIATSMQVAARATTAMVVASKTGGAGGLMVPGKTVYTNTEKRLIAAQASSMAGGGRGGAAGAGAGGGTTIVPYMGGSGGGLPTSGAAAGAAGGRFGKIRGALGRAGRNPIAMMAAFIAADYAISEATAASPGDTGKSTASKKMLSGAGSAGMLWAMLGAPGKGAIGKGLGWAGKGAMQLGGRAVGSSLGMAGVGVAGAGLGTAAAFAAPAAMFAGGIEKARTVEGRLRYVHRISNQAVGRRVFDKQEYDRILTGLAADPELANRLRNEKVIDNQVYSDAMSRGRDLLGAGFGSSAVGTMAPTSVINTVAATPSAGTGSNSSTSRSPTLRGTYTSISPEKAVLEITNPYALSAGWEAEKARHRP